MTKAEYYMDTLDFRAGHYVLKDVSHDPSWHDVKCVESHSNQFGLRGVVNHREKDFKRACAALESLGAKRLQQSNT